MQPKIRLRREGQRDLPVLCWRFDAPQRVIASSPHGGGLGLRRWILNATVPTSYGRKDPDRHLGKLGVSFGLPGRGVGLMTAVDVNLVRHASDGEVVAFATVGVTKPTWAAEAEEQAATADGHEVGTINVVAFLPERLVDGALVNAVATVAEAKAQALQELGIPGTGTASDAVCLVCPPEGRTHHFGGPRSGFGARLARATHAAILAGARYTVDGPPHAGGPR
ncbi:MAG: putative adenosylcobinamide amidohydrolase [Acidimicrobiales bacterium]|nr:putative adenosylcobinamide amidohydrolase [Acidimicrobiales bacterium]